MKKKMKPHVFEPGKYRGLPGPYCRHCHYSEEVADSRGCPNRYYWPRPKKITDTQRLDEVIKNPDILMDWKYGEPYGIKVPKDPRKSIDAAIRSEKGRKKA